jgi:transcriptional regulator with PAS, ATPase and Fis domain
LKGMNWSTDFPGSIIVCDLQGIILEMNARAADIFRTQGGMDLVGKNLLDCHPEPSRSKLVRLLETGERNVYTIEKNGIKKIIYQSPWYQEDQRQGIVELALEIPFDLPHFVRE